MQSELGFQVEEYRLRYTRIMSISVGLLYPLVGHLLLFIDDSAIEMMSHRYLIGLSMMLICVSTYFSDFFKSNSIYFLYVPLTIGVLWAIWIVDVNNFSLNYTALMITAIAATAAMILHRGVLIIFLLLVSIVLFLTISQNEYSGFSPYSVVFCCVILGTVLLINNNYKNSIKNEVFELNQKLGKYNSDLELEVEERTKLLRQKNIELENYTYLVSHDLKSPLTNAISFANLIGKNLEDRNYEALGHHITIINQSANRMSSILSDLLIHGKIGLTEVNYETIDLRNLIDHVIASSFKAKIDNGVVIEVDQKLPKMITGDRQQLSLLMQNLISNGIKYNKSKKKEVHISGHKTDGKITVTITDNGIGFVSEESEKLFDMFRRLHSKDDYEGTGLGLAICKRVVDNHKGQIKASSIVNEGSRFEFTI